MPQSTQGMLETIERRVGPSGREYYWLTGAFTNPVDQADTDRHAVSDGYVCVTPLTIDPTAHERLKAMGGWSWPDLSAGAPRPTDCGSGSARA